MVTRRIRAGVMSAVITLGVALSGQAMAMITEKDAAELDAKAKATLTKFQAETKGAEAVFANAKGILVCPSITKGGLIVGVESGNCVLTKGAPTPLYYGTSGLKFGLLAGVQSYSMILVLNTPEAVAKFTSGSREWELGVDASVAVAKIGTGGSLDTTNLKKDIVSFIFSPKGLMGDVSFESSRFKKQDVVSAQTASLGSGDLKFTAEGGPYATRGSAEKVEIFVGAASAKPFTRVGWIEWDYTSNTVELHLIDLIPALQQAAYDHGGEAVVVREFGYQGNADPGKPFRVRGDVIRWQP